MADTTKTMPRVPKALSASARAYLSELASAAQLVQLRRDEADIAERGRWLMLPAGRAKAAAAAAGVDGALNSPLMHVDGYRMHRVFDEQHAARADVGRVAWWYATAALAALDAVLSGQEITARHLERQTLLLPGRDQALLEAGDVSPWHRLYRPHLPGKGELRTGVETWDRELDAALEPLRAAYAAVELAEDIERQEDESEPDSDAEDGQERGMTEWEANELTRCEKRAVTIPDLLIAYAEIVMDTAMRAAR